MTCDTPGQILTCQLLPSGRQQDTVADCSSVVYALGSDADNVLHRRDATLKLNCRHSLLSEVQKVVT